MCEKNAASPVASYSFLRRGGGGGGEDGRSGEVEREGQTNNKDIQEDKD